MTPSFAKDLNRPINDLSSNHFLRSKLLNVMLAELDVEFTNLSDVTLN